MTKKGNIVTSKHWSKYGGMKIHASMVRDKLLNDFGKTFRKSTKADLVHAFYPAINTPRYLFN